MGFKNKLASKLPYSYILAKTKSTELIKAYRIIKNQNLFDEEFYLSKYKKVKDSGMDPLIHYLFFGYLEGKKPFKNFDGAYYSYHYDVKSNPLVHYALEGKDKNYSYTSPDLDLEILNRKAPLLILHEKITNMGGASLTILDIIKTFDFAYILTSDGEDVELWKFDSKLEKLKNWEINHKTDYSLIDDNEMIIAKKGEKQFFDNKLKSIYEEILSKLDISFIHVNHLINHSFDLFESAKDFDISYLINIHDFYYCCPSIHLLDENLHFCNIDCCNNCGINIDNKNELPEILKIWQNLNKKYLKESFVNILPSNSTLEIYKTFFPDLTNFKIIEPGRDLDILTHDSYYEKKKIKILIPGHISPHKGSLLIKSIKELDKNNLLELHFAGTTIPNLNSYGINHGRYNRDEFNNLVEEIKPSYIAILSQCMETYSHTLTEAIAAQIPVITTDLGALKERVEKYNIGWTFKDDAKEICDGILEIDEEDYNKKLENISKVKLPSYETMIEEYNNIYSNI